MLSAVLEGADYHLLVGLGFRVEGAGSSMLLYPFFNTILLFKTALSVE